MLLNAHLDLRSTEELNETLKLLSKTMRMVPPWASIQSLKSELKQLTQRAIDIRNRHFTEHPERYRR